MSVERPPACVVVGDVSLDVVCSVGQPHTVDDLAACRDVAADAATTMKLGGGAWLFTEALLASAAATVPIVVAPIGADLAAQFVHAEFAARGLVGTGLLTVAGQATNVCLMVYFAHRQRLMTFPSSTAPKIDSPPDCIRALDAVRGQYRLTLAWISGHSMVRPSPQRVDTLRAVCEAVRSDGGRVVFDLVPHEFAKAVDDGTVAAILKAVDGVVGEHATLADLGLAVASDHNNSRSQLIAAAEATSSTVGLCIVQGRTGTTTYAQAVALDGELTDWREVEFSTETLRGLGDRLAVDALLRTSFL